ncbi:hypothetical protein ACFTAO_45085 [Paenibacillus rhizoplanae]
MNSVKGLKAIEYEAWELFSTYKGTKSEIFWKLRLPTSLPYIFSALKNIHLACHCRSHRRRIRRCQ